MFDQFTTYSPADALIRIIIVPCPPPHLPHPDLAILRPPQSWIKSMEFSLLLVLRPIDHPHLRRLNL
jgi:hypothetical protein